MKEYGIRIAKAHLSQIARVAAGGECSIVTNNRKRVAMIGPPPADLVGTEVPPRPLDETKPLSDAAAFRQALLVAPHPLELDF
jgi:hypothetical protein